MFPIPWNKAYRKKDGSLVNIDDAMSGGGGSSELPEYSEADAGKVLAVNDSGELAWGSELPEYSEADAGKVLGVNDSGELAWAIVSSSDNHYSRISKPLATIGINEGDVEEV